MATSVLMASHDNNTNLALSEEDHHLQTTTTRHDHYQTARQSNLTPRRKLTRVNESKKKQPQRGMGVAQLERLRLGDRWKKMTEINHCNTTPSSLPYTVIPTSFAHDPAASLNNTLPFHWAKYGGFGSSTTGTVNGVAGLNLNPPAAAALLVQRVGLFHGQGLVSHDKFQGNVYGSENSKELSSTPNAINCYSDQCSVCHGKKRNVVGENLVYKGVKDMKAEMSSSHISSCDFVGFNVDNSQNNKGRTNQGFGKNASFHAAPTYSVGNIDQGSVDVVAVHRGGNGSVFMEYNFFPAISVQKGGKSNSHGTENESTTTTMKKAMVGGDSFSESSSSVGAVMMMNIAGDDTHTTAVNVDDSSTSIDLSLGFSY